MAISCPFAATSIILFFSFLFSHAQAQISTPCTSSVISTFTPCFNFITGSSGGGGSSPTEDCCNSLKSLMTDNVDCACLIVTGNVPVSIPFVNSSLAISLPQACGNSVPLQCKATGVPLPPPGPVLFGPPPAPSPAPVLEEPLPPTAISPTPTLALAPTPAPAPHSHRHRPKVSKASSMGTPAPVQSSSDKGLEAAPPNFSSLGPAVNPGIRPVYNPNSASMSTTPSLIILLSLFLLAPLFAGEFVEAAIN